VGIVAEVAIDAEEDRDLVSLSAAHLFPVHTTWIGFPRDGLLRGYMYEFLGLVGPHLTAKLVDRAASCRTQLEIDELFTDVDLPVR
jgi:LysR family cys regulon transcriptional activator